MVTHTEFDQISLENELTKTQGALIDQAFYEQLMYRNIDRQAYFQAQIACELALREQGVARADFRLHFLQAHLCFANQDFNQVKQACYEALLGLFAETQRPANLDRLAVATVVLYESARLLQKGSLRELIPQQVILEKTAENQLLAYYFQYRLVSLFPQREQFYAPDSVENQTLTAFEDVSFRAKELYQGIKALQQLLVQPQVYGQAFRQKIAAYLTTLQTTSIAIFEQFATQHLFGLFQPDDSEAVKAYLLARAQQANVTLQVLTVTWQAETGYFHLQTTKADYAIRALDGFISKKGVVA